MTTTSATIQTYEFDATTGEASEGTGVWASDLRLGFEDGTSDVLTSVEFDHQPTDAEAAGALRSQFVPSLSSEARALIEAL